MLEEGRSTLTHSITQMAQAFASVQASHTIAADPSPVDTADANLLGNAVSQDKDHLVRG
jgi:hypothetical protein